MGFERTTTGMGMEGFLIGLTTLHMSTEILALADSKDNRKIQIERLMQLKRLRSIWKCSEGWWWVFQPLFVWGECLLNVLSDPNGCSQVAGGWTSILIIRHICLGLRQVTKCREMSWWRFTKDVRRLVFFRSIQYPTLYPFNFKRTRTCSVKFCHMQSALFFFGDPPRSSFCKPGQCKAECWEFVLFDSVWSGFSEGNFSAETS